MDKAHIKPFLFHFFLYELVNLGHKLACKIISYFSNLSKIIFEQFLTRNQFLLLKKIQNLAEFNQIRKFGH
jgi:hypothetical protein